MAEIVYPHMRKCDVDKIDGKNYVVGTSKRTLEEYGVDDTLFGSPYTILTFDADRVIWVEGFDSMQGCLNRLGDTPSHAVEFLSLQ